MGWRLLVLVGLGVIREECGKYNCFLSLVAGVAGVVRIRLLKVGKLFLIVGVVFMLGVRLKEGFLRRWAVCIFYSGN